MVCPLKELDVSALSASPRRLIEGVLEVEGPTSAGAGVASCLLVIRRLRDDFCDGKIFVVGMRRLGGIELQKGAPWECSLNSGAFAVANGKLELRDRKAEGHLEQLGNSATARLPDGHSRHENKTRELCDKQRYYLDLAKSRGRIGSIASQQCLYQLSILCK